MSKGKDLDRRNGCDGKMRIRHGTVAVDVLRRWVEREGLDLYVFSIYPCRNCRHWHIGRYRPAEMARGDSIEINRERRESPNGASRERYGSGAPRRYQVPELEFHNGYKQPSLFWKSGGSGSWVHWDGVVEPRRVRRNELSIKIQRQVSGNDHA